MVLALGGGSCADTRCGRSFDLYAVRSLLPDGTGEVRSSSSALRIGKVVGSPGNVEPSDCD